MIYRISGNSHDLFSIARYQLIAIITINLVVTKPTKIIQSMEKIKNLEVTKQIPILNELKDKMLIPKNLVERGVLEVKIEVKATEVSEGIRNFR